MKRLRNILTVVLLALGMLLPARPTVFPQRKTALWPNSTAWPNVTM